MLGFILLSVGIAGFSIGGYLDLKSTEFPDWLPYSMILLALASRGMYALFYNAWSQLISSVVVGVAFLALGLLLYVFKQWGDGDAWLLGALGFLFPEPGGFVPMVPGTMPFPLYTLCNFFLISFFYLVVYSLALGIRSPKVFRFLYDSLRASSKTISAVFSISMVIALVISFYISQSTGLAMSRLSALMLAPFAILLMLVFLQYARVVEDKLFKRHIPASKVKVGDVLLTDKWRGVTEPEIEKLKRKGGKVWIKEGVRFAPVFIITLLVTVGFGSLMEFLMML